MTDKVLSTRKTTGGSAFNYKIELDTLLYDPASSCPVPVAEDDELARMLLASLPFLDEMRVRAETEPRVVGFRVYQAGMYGKPDWALIYQWAPTQEWLAERLSAYALKASKQDSACDDGVTCIHRCAEHAKRCFRRDHANPLLDTGCTSWVEFDATHGCSRVSKEAAPADPSSYFAGLAPALRRVDEALSSAALAVRTAVAAAEGLSVPTSVPAAEPRPNPVPKESLRLMTALAEVCEPGFVIEGLADGLREADSVVFPEPVYLALMARYPGVDELDRGGRRLTFSSHRRRATNARLLDANRHHVGLIRDLHVKMDREEA